MPRPSSALLAILTVALFAACQPEQAPFEGWYTEVPSMEFPLDNPANDQVAALGHDLFFDPVLSVDSTVSCASCHRPEWAFADQQALSAGVDGGLGTRNSPAQHSTSKLRVLNGVWIQKESPVVVAH